MGFFDLIVPDLRYLDKNSGRWKRLGSNYTPLQKKMLVTAEEQIRDGKPIRMIVLKARQMGCSTITQGMMFQFLMCFPNTRGMTMAHENESAKGIHKMIQGFWDLAPASLHYTHRAVSQREDGMAWDNRSSMRIASARNREAGRGGTIRAMHNSEIAFYEDPETMMGGLDQAMPRAPETIRIIESTANGVGDFFHSMWEDSVANPTAYTPLFFAWWQHPFYTADHIGLGHLADRPLLDTTGEEKILIRVFARKLGMDAREIRSRLIWRREFLRVECHGDIDMLHQEYPTTPDEAFVATGRNVFNLAYLSRVYEPLPPRVGHLFREGNRITFREDPTGPVFLYKPPSRDSWYTVGGDPSRGPMGDYAVCQVIDRKSWEQVAVFRRRGMHGAEFAEEMLKLGTFYNQGLLAPETNLAGDGVAQILRTTYPHIFLHQKANKVPGQHDKTYGWVTNNQTKAEAIGNLQKAILDACNDELPGIGIVIHDADTFAELRGYVNLNGKFMNGRGTDHDDTVMALAIAVTVTMYEAASMFSDAPPAYGQSTAFAHTTPGDHGLWTPDQAQTAQGFGKLGTGSDMPMMVPAMQQADDGSMGMPSELVRPRELGGFGDAPWEDDVQSRDWHDMTVY